MYLYRHVSFFCLWVFLLHCYGLFLPVDSAPKSSRSKRLAEYEAAADVDGDGGASSRVSHGRGHRQRLQDAESMGAVCDAASNPKDASLINSLKRDWAAGQLPANKVQEYALGAARQGAHGLDALSAMGSHGDNPSVIHRALLRIFGNPKGAPSIDWINIPGKDGKLICQPFLMPHKFFASLYNERPEFFQSSSPRPRTGCPRILGESALIGFFQTPPALEGF